MTEVSVQNDEFIVRVQAQVMMRDDSSGGWVPMGGGGLSNVGLRKVTRKNGEDLLHNEYLIYGTRIADNSVVLDCLLKRDIRYVKANPKFHHWQTDAKRFGLTFERYDDAKAFDMGIQSAVADLGDGGTNGPTDGDDEVFAILDLPISRSSSQSASTTSTTTSSPTPQSPTSNVSTQDPYHSHNHHHVHRVHYVSSSPHKANKKPPTTPQSDGSSKSDCYHQEVWVHGDDPNSFSSKSDQGLLDSRSEHEMKEYYVFIAKTQKPHEYSYPTLESVHKPPSKRETTSNIKHQPSIQEHPPLPKKKDKKRTNHPLLGSSKFRCKHCHDNFTQEENGRGSCEEAPDGVEKCIECVTCVWCAKGLIYHCMSDPDGDYGHPCYCDPSDANNCKKWTALTILSFFVPCLWCYWPLTACHKCGVKCGCCGGRHKAVV